MLIIRGIPCLKINVLNTILELISEEDLVGAVFKINLKEDKHYFLILKTFQDSYYDVQTYCAQILKRLDLETSIREKISSFLNYVISPPDEREMDVSLNDMNAYRDPIFTNKVRNILDQAEDLQQKSTKGEVASEGNLTRARPSRKIVKFGSAEAHYVQKRESKYLKEIAQLSSELDDSSAATREIANRKISDFDSSASSLNDSNIMSPKQIMRKERNLQTQFQEEDKGGENDAIDNYLNKLMEDRLYKEMPIHSDDKKLEYQEARKSGKSISPTRQDSSERKTITRLVESTNIPLTASISSDIEEFKEFTEDEDIILEELNDLYQVFLSWIFSSKRDLDSSRPIQYKMMLSFCLNLSAKSTKLMKQKALSDLHFMTAVEKNASIIMGEKTFNRWILDLLYSVFPPQQDQEKDPLWDMGCKLFIQIAKMCFNTDPNAHTYIHNLI